MVHTRSSLPRRCAKNTNPLTTSAFASNSEQNVIKTEEDESIIDLSVEKKPFCSPRQERLERRHAISMNSPWSLSSFLSTLPRKFTGCERLDTKNMRMMDLINWNPRNEKKMEHKIFNEVVTGKASSQRSIVAPQVRVGTDGNLEVDTESLLINTTDKWENCEQAADDSPNNVLNNMSFRRNTCKKSAHWTTKETALFYDVLRRTGTDFTLMHQSFPIRTRNELKSKYQREIKFNPARIQKSLEKPIPLSQSFLDATILKAKQIQSEIKSKRGYGKNVEEMDNTAGDDAAKFAATISGISLSVPSSSTDTCQPDLPKTCAPTNSPTNFEEIEIESSIDTIEQNSASPLPNDECISHLFEPPFCATSDFQENDLHIDVADVNISELDNDELLSCSEISPSSNSIKPLDFGADFPAGSLYEDTEIIDKSNVYDEEQVTLTTLQNVQHPLPVSTDSECASVCSSVTCNPSTGVLPILRPPIPMFSGCSTKKQSADTSLAALRLKHKYKECTIGCDDLVMGNIEVEALKPYVPLKATPTDRLWVNRFKSIGPKRRRANSPVSKRSKVSAKSFALFRDVSSPTPVSEQTSESSASEQISVVPALAKSANSEHIGRRLRKTRKNDPNNASNLKAACKSTCRKNEPKTIPKLKEVRQRKPLCFVTQKQIGNLRIHLSTEAKCQLNTAKISRPTLSR